MHIPRLICSLRTPLRQRPTESPGIAESKVFLNASIERTFTPVGFLLIPIKVKSSPGLHIPCSTVPVATAPLP